MTPQTSRPNAATDEAGQATCTTNMGFNFTVGAIAILVAIIIGYVVYAYVTKG